MARTIKVTLATPPPDGKSIRVIAEGMPIAVFRLGNRLFAIDAICTHAGGPLDQGTLSDTSVECPWHGSIFSIETGKNLRGPATRSVRAYRARHEGSTLTLEVDSPARSEAARDRQDDDEGRWEAEGGH